MADPQVFVTSNWSIRVNNTLGWSAVVSFVGELLLLCENELYLMFYVVSAVHKFVSSPNIYRTPNKWLQAEHGRGLCFWQNLYVFS